MDTTLVTTPTPPSNHLSVAQRRLLGGWRDVTDDIKALCRNLAGLSDTCQCGSGEHHLSGTCPCCHNVATEWVPDCADCNTQLAKLRPAIDLLMIDTRRFFPVVKEVLAHHTPPRVAADALVIERHISDVVRTFDALVVAADQFRTDCRSSHLKTLKELALALSREADALNRAM